MTEQSYNCDCDVIHEEVVNEVKTKMQSKEDYVQLASLFKLFGDVRMRSCRTTWGHKICRFSPVKSIASCKSGKIPQRSPDCLLFSC